MNCFVPWRGVGLWAALLALMMPAGPLQAKADADAVVATVNGQPVTGRLLDELVQVRRQDPRMKDMPRQKVIDDLILSELLSQQARAAGVDRRPEVQAELALQYKSLLAQRYLKRLAQEVSVTDQELRDRYDREPVEIELDTRHILVRDEATAREAIRLLAQGRSFGSVARGLSIDDASKGKGGRIGRQLSSELASTYAQAAASLRPGSYTRTPVHTEFGWHVIWLDALKALPKPAFADVRQGLRQSLVNEKVEARVHALQQAARIERLQAP